MPDIKSSKAQRNGLRTQSGIEITSSALGELLPAAKIPCKVAQSACSLYSFFHANTSRFEKTINLSQAFIATAQVGLLCYVVASKRDCKDQDDWCLALTISDLFYEGILLASAGIAELNKKPHDESPLLSQINSSGNSI